MKWKKFIFIVNKVFYYAYVIALTSGHIAFMQKQPFAIQIVPLIVSLAIELVCNDGEERDT